MKIRTINLTDWQLKKIDRINPNRSDYVREAVKDQLIRDLKNRLFGVANKESKITTVNLPESYISDIGTLIGISSLSYSEYIRRAVQYKLELEMEETILRRKNEKLEKEGFVLIPDYNDDKPVQIIKRLEY